MPTSSDEKREKRLRTPAYFFLSFFLSFFFPLSFFLPFFFLSPFSFLQRPVHLPFLQLGQGIARSSENKKETVSFRRLYATQKTRQAKTIGLGALRNARPLTFRN